jgi:hypothetical protein
MRCPSIDYPITTKLENQAATKPSSAELPQHAKEFGNFALLFPIDPAEGWPCLTAAQSSAERGSFHDPVCAKPATTLSRKDWHSVANRAVL